MKVLYAGDAASKIGPIFVASPFNFEVKGFSHHIWGQPLIDSLNQGGIEVLHMTNEQAISDFPRTVEGLSEYNAVIISDCECEVLALYPFWIAGYAAAAHQPIESHPRIHPQRWGTAYGRRVDLLQRSFRAWWVLRHARGRSAAGDLHERPG